MAALYADEDIGSLLVAGLRRRGHVVLRAVDAGQSRARDHEQLAFATQRGLILVTHNADHFRILHHVWRSWMALGLPPHPGILAIPQPKPERLRSWGYTWQVAVRTIDLFLTSDEKIPNEFHRWHPLHGWTQ